MAVTSWTDNDSNGVPMDWTNPNLADWRYVDALVQAVNERRAAIGQELLIFPDYPGRYLNISILQQIHSAVIALIPQYVNHEDNSGNWTGKTSIPLWSFNSIMDSITGNAYQLDSGTHVKSETVKLWAALMYKCLNKLRWTSITYISKRSYLLDHRYSYVGNFEDFKSFIKANTNPIYIQNTSNGEFSIAYSTQDFNTYRLYCECEYTIYKFYINTKFNVSINHYMMPRLKSSYGWPSSFDSHFKPPNLLFKYKTSNNLSSLFYIECRLEDVDVDQIPWEPDITENYGGYGDIILKIFSASTNYNVAKFDTSGGFAFKDW